MRPHSLALLALLVGCRHPDDRPVAEQPAAAGSASPSASTVPAAHGPMNSRLEAIAIDPARIPGDWRRDDSATDTLVQGDETVFANRWSIAPTSEDKAALRALTARAYRIAGVAISPVTAPAIPGVTSDCAVVSQTDPDERTLRCESSREGSEHVVSTVYARKYASLAAVDEPQFLARGREMITALLAAIPDWDHATVHP